MLFGDSIVYNLGRYPTVWNHWLESSCTNCGIPGDSSQNVLWRVGNGIHFPSTVDIGIIHCGINDILGSKADINFKPEVVAKKLAA